MNVLFTNRNILADNVWELLSSLYTVGFLNESMLVGSWVMPLYQESFGINYVLRTQDVDFAIEFANETKPRTTVADIDKIMIDLGYLPILLQSGIRKFSRKKFSVEFIGHRQGGREDEMLPIKKWNLSAIPLPFIDILLAFPFTADFTDIKIKVPLPEAFFVHKLIIAPRRRDRSKQLKDLEQCAIISNALDKNRLKEVVEFLKPSRKTQRAMIGSCGKIQFPIKELGLQ